jgi:WD40 repeat protein
VADATGTVHLFDVMGERLARGLRKGRSVVTALGWSGDGRLLAVGSKDGTVLLWDTVDDVPRYRQSVFAAEVENLLFHPHRRWLAAGARSEMRIWDVVTGTLALRSVGVPWGFSPDGLVLAASTVNEVAFRDLTLPKEMLRLRGHQAFVQKIIWARSAPRLASLDQAFEAHVWEVGHTSPLARLAGPIGSFTVANAAIALSDDGTRLAFASGGESAAATILDLAPWSDGRAVVEFRRRGPWPLPAGYERLACSGGHRFLLVREERVIRPEDRNRPNAWPVRSVAYELTDAGPRFLRVIRPAEPGDVRRFIDSGLTPDGRYYWWAGPRLPESARRVEIRETATGKLVWSLSAPQACDESSLPHCRLSPDGKWAWVRTPDERRYELPDDHIGEPEIPPDASIPGHWHVHGKRRTDGQNELFLYPWHSKEPWLRLENEDRSPSGMPAFSLMADSSPGPMRAAP